MQASYAGPLAAYNSLTDEHLADFFSHPRRLYHLRRMGLIARDGRIVDESVVRMNAAHQEHHQRAKEIVANSIVNEAVKLEKRRRAEIKRKLEMLAKIERVERVKNQKRHPAGIQEFDPFYSLPPTPPRIPASLQMTLGSSSFSHIADLRQGARKVVHKPSSPYGSPGILTPMPHPPSTPRPNTKSGVRKRSSTIRRRPSTAPPVAKTCSSIPPSKKRQIHSDAQITFCYVGRKLRLEGSEQADVLVLQQHCGGNAVPVYKGKVRPKEHFKFTSRRHLGMPFGLTIYLNGMIDCRVSACCEYKHQCGSFLGGKSSAHFRLVRVENGRPCYKCQEKRERLQCTVKERPGVEIRPEDDLDELIGKLSQPTDPHTYPLESQPEVPVPSLESDKLKKGDSERQETRSPTSSLSSVHSEISPDPKGGAKGRESSASSSLHSVSSDSIHSATGVEDNPSPSVPQECRVTPSPALPESTDYYYPIWNDKSQSSSGSPPKGHKESPAEDADYSYEDDVFEEEEAESEPINNEKTNDEPSGAPKNTIVRQDAQTMTVQTPDKNHTTKNAAGKSTGSDAPSDNVNTNQDVEESTKTPPGPQSPEMPQEAGVSSNKQNPQPANSTVPSSQSVPKNELETQVPMDPTPISPDASSGPVDTKVASLGHSPTEDINSGPSKDGEASQADGDKLLSKAPIPEQNFPELSTAVPEKLSTQKSDTLRGILLSPEKSAATKSNTLRSTLSVSFSTKINTKNASEEEQSSDGTYTPPTTPQEPLSATLTIEDAQKMLKSSSLHSLGSLLREREYASTIEVSSSEDEDDVDFDTKISQIHGDIGIPPSPQTELRISPTSLLSRSPTRISQDVTHMADDVIDITPVGSEKGSDTPRPNTQADISLKDKPTSDSTADAEKTGEDTRAGSLEDKHTSKTDDVEGIGEARLNAQADSSHEGRHISGSKTDDAEGSGEARPSAQADSSHEDKHTSGPKTDDAEGSEEPRPNNWADNSHEEKHTSGSNTHKEPHQYVSAAVLQPVSKNDSHSS